MPWKWKFNDPSGIGLPQLSNLFSSSGRRLHEYGGVGAFPAPLIVGAPPPSITFAQLGIPVPPVLSPPVGVFPVELLGPDPPKLTPAALLPEDAELGLLFGESESRRPPETLLTEFRCNADAESGVDPNGEMPVELGCVAAIRQNPRLTLRAFMTHIPRSQLECSSGL